MFLTAPPLLGRPAREVAVLGNAGGTTARAFGVYYPEARIDGVEIDGAVSDVGSHATSASTTTRASPCTPPTRDRSCAPPTGGTTSSSSTPTGSRTCPSTSRRREFFEEARERLAPDGDHRPQRLDRPRRRPPRARHRRHAGRRVPPGRHVAGAALQPVRRRPERAAAAGALEGAPAARHRRTSSPTARLFAAGLRPAAPAARPWTDDRAPVEWITDRMIAAYAMRGVDESEQLLPTAPD